MKNRICRKLAFKTLLADRRSFLPFLLGTVLVSAMMVCMAALANGVDYDTVRGGYVLGAMLSGGQWIIYLMGLILMFYMNTFFTKSRRQDYGMLSSMGLEKKHLILVLFWQFLAVWLFNCIFGLLLGVGFERLLSLVISKMLGTPILPFTIIWEPIIFSLGLITAIFAIVFLFSSLGLARQNPMALLRHKEAAQKPLKSRWIYTLIGIAALLAGYYISLTTSNAADFVTNFLIAVILVIVGTYFLFVSGFSTLLNSMSRNKKFYYSPNRFISVTNMKYRFRQNAAALATICIFSTMILVAMATTITMWVGARQTIDHSYERQAMISLSDDQISFDQMKENLEKAVADSGVEGVSNMQFSRLVQVGGTMEGSVLVSDPNDPWPNTKIQLYPLSDYNERMGTDYTLNQDEALMFNYGDDASKWNSDTLQIGDDVLTIKEKIPPFETDPRFYLSNPDLALIVADDYMPNGDLVYPFGILSFDLPDGVNESEAMSAIGETYGKENPNPDEGGYGLSWSTRSMEEENMMATVGSSLLIGFYVSLMILIVVILVLYYKQLSEGEEDKKRFTILKRLGLSKKQLKKVVQDQAAMMFFIPLITAMIHICFAYPSLRTLFADSMIYNASTLMIICFGATFAVYAILYLIIYKITSQAYLSAISSSAPGE